MASTSAVTLTLVQLHYIRSEGGRPVPALTLTWALLYAALLTGLINLYFASLYKVEPDIAVPGILGVLSIFLFAYVATYENNTTWLQGAAFLIVFAAYVFYTHSSLLARGLKQASKGDV